MSDEFANFPGCSKIPTENEQRLALQLLAALKRAKAAEADAERLHEATCFLWYGQPIDVPDGWTEPDIQASLAAHEALKETQQP
jgi:hypothetical protein